MMYKLPPLAFSYEALEPHIDALTMELHYSRHHAAYVEGLNKALEGIPSLQNRNLQEIIADIRQVPEEQRQAVRNFGGGHLNHSLFWHILGPASGGEPDGYLRQAIVARFGNIPLFRQAFAEVAMARFGSGWAWLCLDEHGKMELVSTPNQDSPVMLGLRPILGVDVWEHAYYLKYHNRRREYIEAWWNVVNWKNVAHLFSLHAEQIRRPVVKP